jgi:predicted helicase
VAELGLSFMPGAVAAAYVRWPALPELLPVSFPGVQTCRDDFLVAVDRAELEQRLADYFSPAVGHEEIARRYPWAMASSPKVNTRAVREQLLRRGGPQTDKIVRYAYRPFDVRWLYWEPDTDLLDRKREDYFPQVFQGNVTLCAAQQNRKDFDPPITTSVLGCRHLVERGANLFPLLLQPAAGEADLFSAPSAGPAGPQPNLSPAAKVYLQTFGLDAETLFYHILAVLHAPAYRSENAGALRQDWPRVPLPGWARFVVPPSAPAGRNIRPIMSV